jgi:hypothetical protein
MMAQSLASQFKLLPISPPQVVSNPVPRHDDDDEDWDKEARESGYVSYDPMQATVNRKVMRKLEGVTQSVRKEFRANEKERLTGLKEMEVGVQKLRLDQKIRSAVGGPAGSATSFLLIRRLAKAEPVPIVARDVAEDHSIT